ncbi:MAG: hypothetical protein Q9219_003324 [cf. Caloplaca sp. 3 TL-2023]
MAPTQTHSRIAQDLTDSGFDPETLLHLAQADLEHMRNLLRNQEEIEKEYEDLRCEVKDTSAGPIKERLELLKSDMRAMKEESKDAPGQIMELEGDIAMLKKILAVVNDNEGQKGGETRKRNSSGQQYAATAANGAKKAPVKEACSY